jgi:small subunit ribosomal protein S3
LEFPVVCQEGLRSLLHEDLRLKTELKKQLGHAGVSKIEIERPGNKIRITIHTSRPGIIIGRKGSEIDKLKADLQKADEPRHFHQHQRSASP